MIDDQLILISQKRIDWYSYLPRFEEEPISVLPQTSSLVYDEDSELVSKSISYPYRLIQTDPDCSNVSYSLPTKEELKEK